MNDIGPAVANVRRRIAEAAGRVGRDPDRIELMAVSKTVSPPRVQEAVNAGIQVLGENRVQEAMRKIPEVPGPAQWHLIGHLQSNKARPAALLFDAIHSVDRESLVPRLGRAAEARESPLDVYVQVEFVRAGLPEDQIAPTAERVCLAVSEAAALRLQGLMTLPPFDPDPEKARPWFRRLRDIRDEIRQSTGLPLAGLSMGMSGDFEVAIEEGATIVRVGTTIFGARACAVTSQPATNP